MDNKRLLSNLSAGLAVVLLLFAAGYRFVQGETSLVEQVALGLALVSAGLFVYFDPTRVRQWIGGRQARYGSNAVLLFLAFLASVVVLNVLVYQNAQDWGLRWDLTEDQSRTLTDETLLALEQIAELDKPVIVRVFYTPDNANLARVENLLEDYQSFAQGNLVYEVIDPLLNPVQAEQAGSVLGGVILFSLGENVQRVDQVSETAFSNALVALLNPNNKTIYFLTGHGEYGVDQSGADSLSALRFALENKTYSVETLNLLLSPAIPEDAAAVVLAGPQQPITDQEMDLLRAFSDAGGALILAEDASVQTEFTSTNDPVNAYLEEVWGVSLGDDIVIEPEVINSLGGLYAASVYYADHEITVDLQQRNLISIFPIARSVTVVNPQAPNAFVMELISSSEDSWAETNIDSINEGAPEVDADDLAGPVTLAVVGEHGLTGARIVVLGDSDFLSDNGINQFGNRDLALNLVDWATRQEALITLTPRETIQRVIVPPNQNTLALIAILTVFLIPGAVLVSGIVVWMMRRRQT